MKRLLRLSPVIAMLLLSACAAAIAATNDYKVSEKADIEREILAYLSQHPDAQDTMEGIVKWWLIDKRTKLQVDVIQEAVDGLVRRGSLRQVRGRDSQSYYVIIDGKDGAKIQFGDGERGARLPSHKAIADNYIEGAGKSGNPNRDSSKRDNFATGKVLKSEDLQKEQQYNLQRNSLSPGAKTAMQAPLQTPEKVFSPVHITTEKLVISGKPPFRPVNITTEKLIVSGKPPFRPVNITTEKLVVTGKISEQGVIRKFPRHGETIIQKRGVK